MDEKTAYELLNTDFEFQEEALKKLIWILSKNNKSFKRPQNILLLGEVGSGKTTLVESVAHTLEIPLGHAYNVFDKFGNIDKENFMNGIYDLAYSNPEELKGIILLHDFQNCFYNGVFNYMCSLLKAGAFRTTNGACDISKITFVGEINTTSAQDIFNQDYDALEEFKNGNYNDNILKLLKENSEKYDSSGNMIVNPNEVAELFRQQFISNECKKIFSKQIFLEDISLKDMPNIITSPLSSLNDYKDDLDEDYIKSENFLKKVAYQVYESMEGFHYISQAIEDIALEDYKHNVKVYKKGSLLKPVK